MPPKSVLCNLLYVIHFSTFAQELCSDLHLCTVFVTHVLRTPRLRRALDHPHFLRHAIDLVLHQGELGVQGGDFVSEQGVFFPEGFEFFEDFSDEMMNVHSFLKGGCRVKEARGHYTRRPEVKNPRAHGRPAGEESTGGLIVKSTRLSVGQTYVRSGWEKAVARVNHEAEEHRQARKPVNEILIQSFSRGNSGVSFGSALL